jgi:hypothetical protein
MDENSNPNRQSSDDTGEPIAGLALIDLETSQGFWPRVRRKIDRRVATAQVLSFSWNLPKVIFLEFLQIAFSVFSPAKDRKGGSR